jgi:hypothetical protein
MALVSSIALLRDCLHFYFGDRGLPRVSSELDSTLCGFTSFCLGVGFGVGLDVDA